MERRCRLCMKHTNDLLNILDYDSDNKTTIVQNISLFFAVEVTLTDHLSKDVCQNCIKFVNYISHRRKVFLDNQDKLKDELYSALKRNCFVKQVSRRVEPVEYKLSDLKIPPAVRNDDIFPTVEIVNLEESDIYKEYKQTSEFTFRKIRPTFKPNNVYRRRLPSQPRVQRQPPPLLPKPPQPMYHFEEIKLEPTIPEDVMIKEEPPVVPMNTWSQYEEESAVPVNCNIVESEMDPFEKDVADKIYLCPICNAVFEDDGSLQLHNKTHSIKVENEAL